MMNTTAPRSSVLLALICLLATLIAGHANAAYVPFFGGPEYNSATRTGYQTSFPPQPFERNLVNNSGTAIGTASKVVSGTSQGQRAFQWSGAGASTTEMSNPPRFSSYATQNWAYAINDSGTVVGAAYNDHFGERPMRWDSSGAATELGILGTRGGGDFTWGQAYAINNAGTTVGYTDRWNGGPFVDRAVRWDAAGNVIELGDLSPASRVIPRSRAVAVNENGTAVGYAQKLLGGVSDRGTRAVRWDGSGIVATELGNLGTDSAGYASSEAYDVNENGTAVGWAAIGRTSSGRAVRWDVQGTAATELGTLGSSAFSWAYAINDAGTTVGVAAKRVDGVELGFRAVRWDASGTAANELGDLGDDADSRAYDINNHGIAVGSAAKIINGVPAGGGAVAWRNNSVAIDLNNLIDPQSGWTLTSAYSISDTGWITGLGVFDPDGTGGLAPYSRLFLLQLPQVPEPATALLATLASAGILAARRRNAPRQ
jgi:hypothetical protein